MRWFGMLAVVGACGTKETPPAAGEVALRLAIPHGVLDPAGFTSVDVVLHVPGQADDERTATIDKSGGAGTFKLGTIEPVAGVQIEATLRNSSGAAVGYGRTAVGEMLAGGAEITVPVRRPIAYLAGAVSRATNASQPDILTWSEAPATVSDLSTSAPLDGTVQVGSQAVLMVAAGPDLYMVTQAITAATGVLTGPATITPISTADHTAGTALAGQMTGAVVDGAGTDDGSKLAIATTTQLFAVDTASGTATALTGGNFARVAIVMTDAGELAAVAIKNRGATTGACAPTAELWWASLSGGGAAPHMVATGGFSDIAADRGHAYYVDACTNQLGEVTATATQMLSTVAGKPTALAVSNGQAYIGIENQPAAMSLVVAPIAPGEPPRTLWTEAAQQVVEAVDFQGVQRQLAAVSVVFAHLEIGAGGDYVALTTSGQFHGVAVPEANFPDIKIDSEELRVFDASTGGIVQRYRSWCQGTILFTPNLDIARWRCALTTGQTAAQSNSTYDHHINSMTFQFGKK
jgi:hypothetical protein